MTQPPPPRKWLLAYRALGLRLPEEHRAWVVQDTAAKSFLTWRNLRTFVWGQVLMLLYAFGQSRSFSWPSRTTLIRFELLVLAVMLFSSREALVRRALRWQRVTKNGTPVATPKPFARLANNEALALGVVILVAWTAGSYLFGVALRPTGVAAAPCREADPNVFERITAGSDGKTKYLTTRMVTFAGSALVVAVVQPNDAAASPSPDPQKAGLEVWVVTGEKIERIADKDQPTSTSFPIVTQIDRLGSSALERAIKCLNPKEKVVR